MVSPAVSLPQSALPIPQEHGGMAVRGKGRENVGQAERAVSIMVGSLLLVNGVKRFSLLGLGIAGVGAALIQRGSTGQCPMYKALGVTGVAMPGERKFLSHPLHQHIRVEKTVTIEKPVGEVYAFWRKLENLPQFMGHLDSVQVVDEKRSIWRAKGVRGKQVEWNADIIDDVENEKIAWRSIEGADVPNAGQMVFEETEQNGTRVKVLLTYEPPAGVIGAAVARLFGAEPSQAVGEDLRQLKQIMEAGEKPTVEGQPQGKC